MRIIRIEKYYVPNPLNIWSFYCVEEFSFVMYTLREVSRRSDQVNWYSRYTSQSFKDAHFFSEQVYMIFFYESELIIWSERREEIKNHKCGVFHETWSIFRWNDQIKLGRLDYIYKNQKLYIKLHHRRNYFWFGSIGQIFNVFEWHLGFKINILLYWFTLNLVFFGHIRFVSRKTIIHLLRCEFAIYR